MVVSDEEKRWIVVGIAMNKVAAPVLRDYIKQGIDTHYAKLDIYCSGLTTPCTLKTLTYHHVNADPNLRRLKFQNINNNLRNHGNHKNLYNHNINSSIDLAKLFLPDYLVEFSAFDESLDMSVILRLLGFNNPAPIFPSPNPLISIQLSADDVRENVRNKWGHCNVTDWTEVLFNDCFSKMETLMRSLGLTGDIEKTALDQLSDWQTKGWHLCMGHAVDKDLLALVQREVKGIIKDLALHDARLDAVEEKLKEEEEARRRGNDERYGILVSIEKNLNEDLLKRVQGVEESLAAANIKVEELGKDLAKTNERVEELGQGLAKTDDKVEELGQGLAKTDERVEELGKGLTKTDDKVEELGQGLAKRDNNVEELGQGLAKTNEKVEQLGQGLAKTDENVKEFGQGLAKTNDTVEKLGQGMAQTDDKVKKLVQGLARTDEKVEELGQGLEGLEREIKSEKIKDIKPDTSPCPTEPFNVINCRSKLAEHYKRTATVPTSVWSKTSPVDIHHIYTRLSWVREEQTPAGPSQSRLSHYTDVFTAKKNGVLPKRILVQGQTGIGKSTFVKKLAVDWAELNDEEAEEQENAQKNFEDERDKREADTETSQDDEGVSSEDDEYTLREDTSSDDEYEHMSVVQKKALKKFELVLVINLKEVSKCQSLRDILRHSFAFSEEETALTEDLVCYITKHQEKVLLLIDGYDEYRCGRNSEIYEIFRGRKLKNCCVLITTRISKADELREFKDVHAAITGFSKRDRKTFMRRMLGGEAEAKELKRHLSKENLDDLTRVPLLLLFFCTLWKKGKLKSFPETKTKLYLAIVQYVLDYNQGKGSPVCFGKVEDFKEILAEIGKVALECLLKDDHVFEYNQLSAAILCEESPVIGLLQVTEYAENLRPAGVVSFVHKSIQEFLAAWYITYKCVPEGNLGEIEQHARTLENCQALENVFQFICGLSDDGAVRVFQHFTFVKNSHPTPELTKLTSDFSKEKDVQLCDVTYMHWGFNDLLLYCFREVQSKAGLLETLV